MKKPHHTETEAFAIDLYRALLSLKTPEECEAFLKDLCTPSELDAFIDRWRVAQGLHSGLSQRAVQEQTGVSIATVTRVAQFLNRGFGGYQAVLKRMGA